MLKDLIKVGIIYCFIVQLGIILFLNYKQNKTIEDLEQTKEVVYYLSDKLDEYRIMVNSLNEEQINMQKEINSLVEFKRIKKELDRSFTRK